VLHLLDSELRRFLARRTVRIVVALALLLITIVQVTQMARASTTTRTVHHYELSNPACKFPELQPTDAAGTTAPLDCRVQDRLDVVPADRRPHIASRLVDTIKGVGGGYLAVSVVLGATYVGADWMCGAIGTLLLFEPRRLRVYLAKIVACMIGVVLAGAVVYAWLVLTMWVASATRGTTAGLDGHVVHHAGGALLRVFGAAAMGSAIGFAIASATRRTVAAVGVVFGIAIFEPFLFHLWHAWRHVPLIESFAWIISGGFSGATDSSLGTMGQAVRVALGWTILLVAGGAVVFQRREVR
jgi:ABC-2 type transport system permease protein